MKQYENLSVAIIAGGKSRRFGEPKVLARFGNRTLLEHALQVAKNVSPRVMVITGENTFELPIPVSSYPDILPACGPLGGVYTALVYAQTLFVATLPCDMPLLSSELYREMYRCSDGERPVVALSHKGLEPLIALWPRTALNVIQEHLFSGKFKLREVFETLGKIEVDFPRLLSPYNPEIFYNVNTKQDLEYLFKLSDSSEMLPVPRAALKTPGWKNERP